MLFRPLLTDARGKRTRLLGPPALGRLPIMMPVNRQSRQIRRRIEAGVDLNRPVDWQTAGSWTVIWAGSLLVLGILVAPRTPLRHGPAWLGLLLGPLLGVSIGVLTLALQRRVAAKRFAHAYVTAGICPACGYDVGASPVEPDGCRVCPECGGAWAAIVNDE